MKAALVLLAGLAAATAFMTPAVRPTAATGLSRALPAPLSPVTLEEAGASGRGRSLSMMRHGRRVKRLGRPADQRKALLRSLTTSIISNGRVTTTVVKARAVRKHVDHMIQLAKRGDLHARRQALAYLYDKNLVAALFEQAPERYGERNGGYTRVIREPMARRGDGAPMAIIELV